ncbi:MAG: D-alanyl-D-alanine carboxypeptidase family protein [Patescibacteria group bacterium]
MINPIKKTKELLKLIRPENRGIFYTFLIFALLIIFIGTYGQINLSRLNDKINNQSGDISSLKQQLASSTASLQENIASTRNTLSIALDQEKQNVGNIAQKLGTYQQQVGDVSSTVSTLQKLSKTDSQLLQKYSKVFFLNEYYAPARLAEITSDYKYSDSKSLQVIPEVWTYLKKMIDGAKKDNVITYVFSAYRSFNEQQALKGAYTVNYGAGSANSFSADQGYSEHQLGTTVDLITSGLGGVLDGFDATKTYTWLLANAYRYGFIISYSKDNKFYVFEPWHWRFVGVKLATYLHDQKKNFYDLDQRTIDDYLVNFYE